LPNIQRQRCTCYALCHILYPVSAALKSIFRMDSNCTSYYESRYDISLPLATELASDFALAGGRTQVNFRRTINFKQSTLGYSSQDK